MDPLTYRLDPRDRITLTDASLFTSASNQSPATTTSSSFMLQPETSPYHVAYNQEYPGLKLNFYRFGFVTTVSLLTILFYYVYHSSPVLSDPFHYHSCRNYKMPDSHSIVKLYCSENNNCVYSSPTFSPETPIDQLLSDSISGLKNPHFTVLSLLHNDPGQASKSHDEGCEIEKMGNWQKSGKTEVFFTPVLSETVDPLDLSSETRRYFAERFPLWSPGILQAVEQLEHSLTSPTSTVTLLVSHSGSVKPATVVACYILKKGEKQIRSLTTHGHSLLMWYCLYLQKPSCEGLIAKKTAEDTELRRRI